MNSIVGILSAAAISREQLRVGNQFSIKDAVHGSRSLISCQFPFSESVWSIKSPANEHESTKHVSCCSAKTRNCVVIHKWRTRRNFSFYIERKSFLIPDNVFCLWINKSPLVLRLKIHQWTRSKVSFSLFAFAVQLLSILSQFHRKAHRESKLSEASHNF